MTAGRTKHTRPAGESGSEVTRQREFVKVEKNLSTLGFFTPSKSRGKVEVSEKTVRFKREINGKTIDAEATILPSAKYGLPSTADQDKYLAFQKIVNDLRLQQGQVSNPIGFTSTQLLNVLGIKNAGNNYQDVFEWLQRMTLTGISSKGVVYFARRRAWATDTFHVFDRVAAFGMQMPDGSVADRNYVWLSEWQLENINNNYVLPIDFETYRKLKNHIAKALVPLLQVWLYASRSERRFEKRYEDLCTILDIRRQKHLSLIKKQLEPSLAELQFHGYLSSVRIEPTSDGRDYKIVAEHGGKFFRDHKPRAALSGETEGVSEDSSPPLLAALTERGLNQKQARRLLAAIPREQPVMDQLEYGDWLIARSKSAIQNPPGFYTYLLRENILPPDSFETSAKRLMREASTEERRKSHLHRAELEQAYERFCEEEINRFLETEMDEASFHSLVIRKIKDIKSTWPRLPDDTLTEIAERSVRADLKKTVLLPSFETFCCRSPQITLFAV